MRFGLNAVHLTSSMHFLRVLRYNDHYLWLAEDNYLLFHPLYSVSFTIASFVSRRHFLRLVALEGFWSLRESGIFVCYLKDLCYKYIQGVTEIQVQN